jgi:hypothetical protein
MATATGDLMRNWCWAREIVVTILVVWISLAAPAVAWADTVDDMVADFREHGNDIQATQLRQTAQAFRRGDKQQGRASTELYFCGLVSGFPSRSDRNRFQAACDYLRGLDTPAGVAVGGRGHLGGFDAAAVQQATGRKNPLPDGSLDRAFETSNCGGMGCFNVWQGLCRDGPAGIVASAKDCDLLDSVSVALKAAQTELDCGAGVPKAIARIDPAVHSFSNAAGLTKNISGVLNARISAKTPEIKQCWARTDVLPLRCLGGLGAQANRSSYDVYHSALASKFRDELQSRLFPGLSAFLKDELAAIEAVAQVVRRRCAVPAEGVALAPDDFFAKQQCAPQNLPAKDLSELQATYRNAWDDAKWKETRADECHTLQTTAACDGIPVYLSQLPNGRHAEEAQHLLDDVEWKATRADTCRDPKSPSACDLVESYLKEHPSGGHAQAAQQLLEAARPKIVSLLDEREWRSASVELCRNPRASTDCNGVQSYLTQPPALHAAEAKELLNAAQVKLASIRKAEKRQRDAQEVIRKLCAVMDNLDELAEEERTQRRIDAASGTKDLAQRRQFAAARIRMSDQRDELLRTLPQIGVTFSRKKSCSR